MSQPTTERTVLRRPMPSDLDIVYRVHSDPKTNLYNPSGLDVDLHASEERLAGWIEHWNEEGFGYWTVMIGEAVGGFAGLQHAAWLGRPVLNLYYRFAPEFWGQGFAVEVARFAVATGLGSFPEVPVFARTKSENIPSQRTALAAGLHRRENLDRHDGTGMATIFVS